MRQVSMQNNTSVPLRRLFKRNAQARMPVPLLWFGCVFFVCLGDVGFAVVAVVDHDAIAERQRLMFRNGPAPILIRIAREITQPKRIRGE